MSSPPGYTALPDDRYPVSGGNAYLALLVRRARALDPELRKTGWRDLLRMACEFSEATRLDQEQCVRYRDAHAVAVEEFRLWSQRRGDLLIAGNRAVALANAEYERGAR